MVMMAMMMMRNRERNTTVCHDLYSVVVNAAIGYPPNEPKLFSCLLLTKTMGIETTTTSLTGPLQLAAYCLFSFSSVIGSFVS